MPTSAVDAQTPMPPIAMPTIWIGTTQIAKTRSAPLLPRIARQLVRRA